MFKEMSTEEKIKFIVNLHKLSKGHRDEILAKYEAQMPGLTSDYERYSTSLATNDVDITSTNKYFSPTFGTNGEPPKGTEEVSPSSSTSAVTKPTSSGTQSPTVDITTNIEQAPMKAVSPLDVPKMNVALDSDITGAPIADGTKGKGLTGKGSMGTGNAINVASLAAQGISSYLEGRDADKSVEEWYSKGVANPVYEDSVSLDKNLDDSYEQSLAANVGAVAKKRLGKSQTSSNAAAANVANVESQTASNRGKTRTNKFNQENELINKENLLNANINTRNVAAEDDYLKRKVQHEKDYVVAKNQVNAKKYDDVKQLAQAAGEYGAEKEYIDLEGEIHSDTDVAVWTEGGYVDSNGKRISKAEYAKRQRKAKRSNRKQS